MYSNENFPIPVVEGLRSLEHDVVTIQERGRASEAVADPEVLKLAISGDRAVLTLNRRDFIRLHNQDSRHAGALLSAPLIPTSQGRRDGFTTQSSQYLIFMDN
ncbi:MAG: DUF5615 family PIN-like protein [Cyanobacteriota bacterium]|nr:DUF5615 family PIN-like protein [Cyanobacteriota bacterium]